MHRPTLQGGNRCRVRQCPRLCSEMQDVYFWNTTMQPEMKAGLKPATNSNGKRKGIPTISQVLDDGTIVELLYDPTDHRTSFAVWRENKWTLEKSIALGNEPSLIPYSAKNNLIKNHVILFPSVPEEYSSEEELIASIRTFIHRYVDVSPLFEKIASYYVLFSWVYDGFNELPYLRLQGDYGSGKTRFLLTVGSLCYKPVFASGASTVSPIFHILDAFRGTLIIDEGDFRASDEKAEIVKILNNGNVKGFPVLRCEVSKNNEFNPRAFNVFGPKIVATRSYYQDRALESRFIMEEMGLRALRNDIPLNLPSSYREESLHLRNKLLLFRFRNLGKDVATEEFVDRKIEPRLNQIFAPLMSIIRDKQVREELFEVARFYHREHILERSMDIEAQVLEVVKDLFFQSLTKKVSVKEITDLFTERFGFNYEGGAVTAKWMGMIIRKKLKLETQKSHGVFVIPVSEQPKLSRLYEKYGLTENEQISPLVKIDPPIYPSGDIGDVGDVEKESNS